MDDFVLSSVSRRISSPLIALALSCVLCYCGNNIYWRDGTGQATTPRGAGMQYADPMLAAPGTGDLHILAGSPAIDAGETLAASGSVDIDGDPRNDGGGIDVGADER